MSQGSGSDYSYPGSGTGTDSENEDSFDYASERSRSQSQSSDDFNEELESISEQLKSLNDSKRSLIISFNDGHLDLIIFASKLSEINKQFTEINLGRSELENRMAGVEIDYSNELDSYSSILKTRNLTPFELQELEAVTLKLKAIRDDYSKNFTTHQQLPQLPDKEVDINWLVLTEEERKQIVKYAKTHRIPIPKKRKSTGIEEFEVQENNFYKQMLMYFPVTIERIGVTSLKSELIIEDNYPFKLYDLLKKDVEERRQLGKLIVLSKEDTQRIVNFNVSKEVTQDVKEQTPPKRKLQRIPFVPTRKLYKQVGDDIVMKYEQSRTGNAYRFMASRNSRTRLNNTNRINIAIVNKLSGDKLIKYSILKKLVVKAESVHLEKLIYSHSKGNQSLDYKKYQGMVDKFIRFINKRDLKFTQDLINKRINKSEIIQLIDNGTLNQSERELPNISALTITDPNEHDYQQGYNENDLKFKSVSIPLIVEVVKEYRRKLMVNSVDQIKQNNLIRLLELLDYNDLMFQEGKISNAKFNKIHVETLNSIIRILGPGKEINEFLQVYNNFLIESFKKLMGFLKLPENTTDYNTMISAWPIEYTEKYDYTSFIGQDILFKLTYKGMKPNNFYNSDIIRTYNQLSIKQPKSGIYTPRATSVYYNVSNGKFSMNPKNEYSLFYISYFKSENNQPVLENGIEKPGTIPFIKVQYDYGDRVVDTWVRVRNIN